MDQNESVLAALQVAFAEKDPPELFTKAYDYFFIPRSSETRQLASEKVATALRALKAYEPLPEWLTQALASKERGLSTDAGESHKNVGHSIDTVLLNNDGFVKTLTDTDTIWKYGIPRLCTLIFVEVFGELPKNKPGTPSHYADGVTDERWETILNTKNMADGETGYRYLLNALAARGVPL